MKKVQGEAEMAVSESEKELQILKTIHERAESVHQRDLARIAGLSLGMTNAILKRLAEKGFIKIRKVNNRNIRYAVTPAGVDQITRRSYRYFKRTIRNVVVYREAIEELVREAKASGFQSLLLIGRSDLDFIVRYACERNGVAYLRRDPEDDEQVFLLYSEDYIPDTEPSEDPSTRDEESRQNRAFLQEYLVR